MEALQNIRNQRILFSPLNWGWGHVSRAIPLLLQLQSQQNVIHLACSSEQKAVFDVYLNEIIYVEWLGYPFRFKGKGNFAIDLLSSAPRLLSFGRKEKKFVQSYVADYNITLVLSDHRYFFRSKEVKSVFITHQLNLPLPKRLHPLQNFHLRLIHFFQEVWVVDNPEMKLSGSLGESNERFKLPMVYLGVLSRFSSQAEGNDKTWTTVLVSGPEPYAQQFYEEQKLRFQNKEIDWCILYKGNCEDRIGTKKFSWLEMDQRLLESKKLISRCGYSTIMDVHYLKCEMEYHPTIGQWEQEYLVSLQK